MAQKTDNRKPVRLAIFDIDGTVFRSSLIIELFNELVRRGIYPMSAQRGVEQEYRAWLDRKGHYNDYVMRLVHVFFREIAGCSVRHIETAVRAVVARQKDRVHRYPRQLFRELHAKGYFTLVISNSPGPMVRRFADTMGFDDAIGHELEVKDGAYTGRSIVNGVSVLGSAWIDKVAIVRHYIATHGLRIDRRNSVMIGDSEGDVPLLSFVGRPIAFNPSLPLARIAQRRGWRIVVERKDAVYDIKHARFVPIAGQAPKVPYGGKK